MSESNTRTLKPKKPQTATMKRRALKLKSIDVSPTKARAQVRALVVSAPQPRHMTHSLSGRREVARIDVDDVRRLPLGGTGD
jgi:hypothetical protein